MIFFRRSLKRELSKVTELLKVDRGSLWREKQKNRFRVLTYQIEYNLFRNPMDMFVFLSIILREIFRYAPNLVVLPRFFINLFLSLLPFSKRKIRDNPFSLVEKYKDVIFEEYAEILKIFSSICISGIFGGTLKGSSEYAIFAIDEEFIISDKDVFTFNVDDVKIAYVKPELLKDFKVARKLQEAGVRMIITGESFVDEFNIWKAKSGVWARSQSVGIFGVNSVMVGRYFGKNHKGISFISAPSIFTKNNDGFVAKLNEPEKRGIVVADLYLDSLEEFLAKQPKTYKKYRSFT